MWTTPVPLITLLMAALTVLGLTVPAEQPSAPTARMEFVKIAPGEFMMGCSVRDKECGASVKPAHRVRITKSFEIGKYEVTQAQWEAVMGRNPSYVKGADRPVEQVSWNDAQEFLQKLNALRDGYQYRLPTEAEWEYAARAATTERYYGPSLDAIAWYEGNSGGQTHPVGQKQPNAWGLYDMEGNVWEWTQDWFYSFYYQSSPDVDPQGPAYPAMGRDRSVRGGSWLNRANVTKVSTRSHVAITTRGIALGVRCVREAIPWNLLTPVTLL